LETEERNGAERSRYLLWAKEESDSHLELKCTETQSWIVELLKSNKRPPVNEKIALNKKRVLTGNKVN
jgi:hypothetical protein